MKKLIALLSIATLLSSTTAFAATSPSAQAVVGSVGFGTSSDAQVAADRGMSAAEYYNNTVVETEGVADAVPVGQGGKIIINGVATNLTATLSKVTKSVVSEAAGQAEVLGGTVLNVLNVDFPGANYNVATIDFFLKDLEEGKNIVVKQYVEGEWIDVEVVEVRAEHVVLNLTNAGPIVFVELP